jgi:hypothetical protein
VNAAGRRCAAGLAIIAPMALSYVFRAQIVRAFVALTNTFVHAEHTEHRNVS